LFGLEILAKEQEKLAKKVKRYDDPPNRSSILTGVDVAYSAEYAIGHAIVIDNITKETVNSASVTKEIESDYIPGFFQLREGPILIDLIKKLRTPGIVLVDGNGILHPRRFGLASYLGLKMDVRTIGVAKKLMLGRTGRRSGSAAPIIDQGEVIGKAVWANENRPIYVSIGHRVSLESSVNVVIESSVRGYPDVLRKAHIMSRRLLAKGGY
jgi:deoxyribonuclease V